MSTDDKTNADVRGHAAGNPATPAASLAELAKDEDADVRGHAAGNPATPAAPAQSSPPASVLWR